MAAFPSSDKTFTTKVDGVDYPQASHINDLQGEISALELFLLSATPSGTMWNGKLSVSASSDDLTVSLLNNAGNAPSSTDPVYVNINGTVRQVAAALSITSTGGAGNNYFNSGSSELATLAVPYFVYLIWDSNSSAVGLTFGRKPHYRIAAAGMSTPESENYIWQYSGFTAGDDMANIGYFEAILSATPYNWTVPTFTNDNLRHEPTFESQVMTYVPAVTIITVGSGTLSGQYKISGSSMRGHSAFLFGSGSAMGSGAPTFSLPMTTIDPTLDISTSTGNILDNGTTRYPTYVELSGAIVTVYVINSSGTYSVRGSLSSSVPMTWATGDRMAQTVVGNI